MSGEAGEQRGGNLDRVVGGEAFVKTGGPELLVEALVLERVNSANLPNLKACYADSEGNWNLVTERATGSSLGEMINLRRGWQSDPLEPSRAVNVIREAAKPIRALNKKGIIYRDLNPDHFVFDDQGRVKLVDHARDALPDADGHAWSLEHFGTWETMAPEEFSHNHGARLSGATNVYSLGVILYQLLKGRNPFYVSADVGGETEQYEQSYQLHSQPVTDFEGISEQIRAALEVALAPNPDNRFQTVRDFVNALPG